jgi:hypothetical protein
LQVPKESFLVGKCLSINRGKSLPFNRPKIPNSATLSHVQQDQQSGRSVPQLNKPKQDWLVAHVPVAKRPLKVRDQHDGAAVFSRLKNLTNALANIRRAHSSPSMDDCPFTLTSHRANGPAKLSCGLNRQFWLLPNEAFRRLRHGSLKFLIGHFARNGLIHFAVQALVISGL